jgi:transcriptional regulator with XRE-family HTH domain
VLNRPELASFLRARRERLRPADVGLPDGQRRRTPGLRRQEVAHLAGLSVDYYIRLEQGRGPRPSRQVLAALSRALMLTSDERGYLYRIGGDSPEVVAAPVRSVPAEISHLLDLMPATPAYVVSARYDILCWNRLATYFIGDLSTVPVSNRNMIRWTFSQDLGEAFWSDDDAVAFTRSLVADLRSSYAKFSGNADVSALVTELLALSPRFAALWSECEVAEKRPMRKRVDHPLAGPLEFSCQVLRIGEGDQRLIVYVPEPGSDTEAAFRRLAALDETDRSVATP